jgi:hypothetical protein
MLSFSSSSWAEKLIQDVVSGVVPYGLNRRDSPLKLLVQLPDDEGSKQVATAFGRHDYVDRVVSEFIEECIPSVLLFGEDSYELAYELEANAEGQRQFYFLRIPPMSLDHSGDGMPVQRVPERIARVLGSPTRVVLPRSHLMIIQAPDGVRDQLTNVFERLHFLGDSLFPDFILEDLQDGTRKVPFDSDLYSKTKMLALAEATREVGWTGRGIFGPAGQHTLENYGWRRELVFARFNTELRERIVGTINDALKRAGVVSGINAKVQLSGFPTLAELDAAIDHLQAGSQPLSEIHALLKKLD